MHQVPHLANSPSTPEPPIGSQEALDRAVFEAKGAVAEAAWLSKAAGYNGGINGGVGYWGEGYIAASKSESGPSIVQTDRRIDAKKQSVDGLTSYHVWSEQPVGSGSEGDFGGKIIRRDEDGEIISERSIRSRQTARRLATTIARQVTRQAERVQHDALMRAPTWD